MTPASRNAKEETWELPQSDVALVIGANEVTKPRRPRQRDSPIQGRPNLDVDNASHVAVLNIGMGKSR